MCAERPTKDIQTQDFKNINIRNPMRMAFYAAQRNDELAYGPYPCPDSIPSSSDACRISLWLEGLPRTLPEVLVLHASTPSPAYGPYPCSDSILLLLRLLEAALAGRPTNKLTGSAPWSDELARGPYSCQA